MKIDIEFVQKKRVAFVRHVGPYIECGAAWDKLCALPAVAATFSLNSKFIGVCYDDPKTTAPDKIRYDACVTVPDNFVATDEVGVQEIFGDRYAVTEYVGPYENLAAFYEELCGELASRAFEIKSAPSLEIYKNDPKTTPPEKLLTVIYVPLQ